MFQCPRLVLHICKQETSLQTENTEMNSLSIVHHGVMSKVKEPDPEQLSWYGNYFTRSCEAQLDQQYGLQVVKTMCRRFGNLCWELKRVEREICGTPWLPSPLSPTSAFGRQRCLTLRPGSFDKSTCCIWLLWDSISQLLLRLNEHV